MSIAQSSAGTLAQVRRNAGDNLAVSLIANHLIAPGRREAMPSLIAAPYEAKSPFSIACEVVFTPIAVRFINSQTFPRTLDYK
jgi:hypothetical protein